MGNKSTTKSFAILSVGSLISKIISIVYLPALMVFFGELGMGVYHGGYQVFIFLFSISSSGITVAVSKAVSELVAIRNEKDATRVFVLARRYMSLIAGVISVAMFIFGDNIANMLNVPEAGLSIQALAPAIFFTAIVSVYRGYFQGRQEMLPTAITQIVEQVINVPVSIICASLLIPYGVELGVAGATVGTTAGALIALIMLARTYRKSNPSRFKNELKAIKNRQIIKTLKKYSFPIVITSALIYGGDVINTAMINGILDSSEIFEANALFGRLQNFNSLIAVPITFMTALGQAYLPAIASLMALNDRKEAQRKVNQAVKIALVFLIPAAMAFRELAFPIYKLMFPSGMAGYQIMVDGAIIIVFWGLYLTMITVLQSIGKLYVSTCFSVIGIVIKILLNILLIRIDSVNIFGAIISNMFCYLVPLVLAVLYINNIVKIKIAWKGNIIKITCSAIIMSLLINFVYNPANMIFSFLGGSIGTFAALGVTAVICGYAYFMVLIGLKGFKKEDFETLPGIVMRLIPSFLQKRIN